MPINHKNDKINRETRRNYNVGSFAQLEMLMQKKTVLQTARKYNFNISGLTFKIQRNEKLLALPIAGAADPKNIGRIDLLPKAFVDEKELICTIIHESVHVRQFKKYGSEYTQNNREYMEKVAYRCEEAWYKILAKRSKL